LPFNHSSFEGSFEEGLLTMNEGDSTSYIVDAQNLFTYFFKAELPFFLKAGDKVKMDVKLNKIFNEQEYVQELKRYQELVEDRDIEEQRKLQVYIDTIQTSFTNLGEWHVFSAHETRNGRISRKRRLGSFEF
jgi:hypothetical protein